MRPDLLSGGERQRVAIARALANRPAVVFADEPTANLDSHTAEEILDLMRGFNESYAVAFLFATHDPRVVERARRVVTLHDGAIESDEVVGMSAFALAWRNLVRQKRRSLLMIAVVTFGFASFALAGGFIAQSFEALQEGTIRSVGQLQIVDRRAVGRAEEATLEFGIPDAERARAIAAPRPGVAAVLPRIDFVGLATVGARSIPFLGVGVDPGPEAASTLASGARRRPAGTSRATAGRTSCSAPASRRRSRSSVGDRVTLLATTPDGSLNAVDGVVVGLVDVRIKELNDRYLAGGIGLVERLLQSDGNSLEARRVPAAGRGRREDRRRSLETAMAAAGFPVAVLRWQELAVFYGQVKLLYIGIFGFVGAVLVTIVILSAAIVMTMAVTERTREIGTLRALGTRPAGILRMFLAEGVADRRRGLRRRHALRPARSGPSSTPPASCCRRRPARRAARHAHQRQLLSARVRGRAARHARDDGDRRVLSGAAGLADRDRRRADPCLKARPLLRSALPA